MKSISSVARAAVIVLLAGAAASSAAQSNAAPTAASPAKKELVNKALQLQQTGIENVGIGMANQAAAQLMQMAAPSIARAPEAKRQAVVNDLQAEVRKFQNEVAPILRTSAMKWAPATLGAALEEKFTEDELKTLIAWLESPVNRKFQQIAPEAQQALTQRVIAETRPQIEPKLKSLEQAMVSKLNAATAAPPASAPKPAQGPAKK